MLKRSKSVVSLLLLCCLFLDIFSVRSFHLCERRVMLKAVNYLRVEDIAIVFGHIERRVAHELLESKGIAAAIN